MKKSLLWCFFNSLIWSSKVKFACGPAVISSCTGCVCNPSDDPWSALSVWIWAAFKPPKTRCNWK